MHVRKQDVRVVQVIPSVSEGIKLRSSGLAVSVYNMFVSIWHTIWLSLAHEKLRTWYFMAVPLECHQLNKIFRIVVLELQSDWPTVCFRTLIHIIWEIRKPLLCVLLHLSTFFYKRTCVCFNAYVWRKGFYDRKTNFDNTKGWVILLNRHNIPYVVPILRVKLKWDFSFSPQVSQTFKCLYNKEICIWASWHLPVIQVFGRLWQNCCEFKAWAT